MLNMENAVYLFIINLIKIIAAVCDCKIKKNNCDKCHSIKLKNDFPYDQYKIIMKHYLDQHQSDYDLDLDGDDFSEDDKVSCTNCAHKKLEQLEQNPLSKCFKIKKYTPKHECKIKNIEKVLFNVFRSISDLLKDKIFLLEDKIINEIVNKNEKTMDYVENAIEKIQGTMQEKITEIEQGLIDNLTCLFDKINTRAKKNMQSLSTIFQDDVSNKVNSLKNLSDEDILTAIKSDLFVKDINTFVTKYIRNTEVILDTTDSDILFTNKSELNTKLHDVSGDIIEVANETKTRLKSLVLSNKKKLKKINDNLIEEFITDLFKTFNNLFNSSMFNTMLIVNDVIGSITKK